MQLDIMASISLAQKKTLFNSKKKMKGKKTKIKKVTTKTKENDIEALMTSVTWMFCLV